MRTARRVVLSVVGLFLLAFPANAQLCVNCDTGGAGCIVTVGQPGFWECTNMGGGSCLLEEPGCGPITLLRELGSDGLRVPVLAEVGEAALAWGEMTFDGDLPAGLTASLAADGREVLRDCNGAIVGRRPSVVIADGDTTGTIFVI